MDLLHRSALHIHALKRHPPPSNTKQLHNILEELSNTTYFRLMHINLDGKCRFFNKAVAEAKCSAGAPAPPAPAFADPFSVSPVEEPPAMCSLATDGGGRPGGKSFSGVGGAGGGGGGGGDNSSVYSALSSIMPNQSVTHPTGRKRFINSVDQYHETPLIWACTFDRSSVP